MASIPVRLIAWSGDNSGGNTIVKLIMPKKRQNKFLILIYLHNVMI